MVQAQGMRLIQKYGLQLLVVAALLLAPVEVISGDHLVSDYGAIGDGITLNTNSIQKAIDQCALEGGGRVVFGPGSFLSGTLVMKDHVELHVTKEALLLGSTNPGDYPEMVTAYRFYGDEWVKQSLIFGANLEDIAISGEGVIDGQGEAFQVTTKLKPDRYRNRPFLIRFTECSGVEVRDVTMQNSAMWMQHYLACDKVLIENIKVYNHCNKNNDMIDIDGCRDVVIRGCVGDSDDDALTLKSTSPRACENVSISNCILSSHCNAIKLGTESTGGFKNITITDCVVKPSSKKEVIYGLSKGISGISLEVVDGGIMDGVLISNVVIDGPEVPLFIRLGNRARPHMEGIESPGVGEVKNIRIEDLVVRNGGKTACSITGIPGFPVRNITLSNIAMELVGGEEAQDPPKEVPELEDLYPEATMFGVLPASTLYMRHVDQIDLSEIFVTLQNPDKRIPLIAEDVKGVEYAEIYVDGLEENHVLEK
jgi:polygalacturonase